MFLQIPMSCQYSLDIPDIDEYFGNKDKIYNQKIQDYKRKVNSCRNRLEKLKFRINDQQILEDEYQDINKQQKIKQINNDNSSQEKKDYFYYENRIHTTINENYQLKSNQVNKFNQKLYSLMSNRDRSLEQKSQRLKNIIQGQKYLDDTQNLLKKSRNYSVQQSRSQIKITLYIKVLIKIIRQY
ncbi:unnamed protein product [Paramecium primaurelia]|uniref:Uncharacterized protein n=1 Tax=Paramecium primaurelia TaxID=5886 RepID=A0A8S1NPZ5_PARPR|nr:unnamed protein product [Paramecium primaurelia]CAD8091195.1 unnamed protein product [Paramecium primaurelia]